MVYKRQGSGSSECTTDGDSMAHHPAPRCVTQERRLHNEVNERLMQTPDDIANDPAAPKVQFPTSAQCPACRTDIDGLKRVFF